MGSSSSSTFRWPTFPWRWQLVSLSPWALCDHLSCSFYIPRRPFSQEKERQRVEMAAAAALPSFFFSSSSSVLISNWSVVVGYLMIMAQKKKDSLLLPLLLNRSLPDRLVCRWWAMRANSGLKLPITRLNRGISLCMLGTMGSFQGRLQQQQ